MFEAKARSFFSTERPYSGQSLVCFTPVPLDPSDVTPISTIFFAPDFKEQFIREDPEGAYMIAVSNNPKKYIKSVMFGVFYGVSHDVRKNSPWLSLYPPTYIFWFGGPPPFRNFYLKRAYIWDLKKNTTEQVDTRDYGSNRIVPGQYMTDSYCSEFLKQRSIGEISDKLGRVPELTPQAVIMRFEDKDLKFGDLNLPPPSKYDGVFTIKILK